MKRTYKFANIGAIVAIFVALYLVFFATPTQKNVPAPQATPALTTSTTIVAFGDSLTAGYNLPASESFPAQLQAALTDTGYSVAVINSGVSGETTKGNLERAAFIRAQKPAIVLLGIGGNDALRSLPVEDTKRNIEETIQILQGGESPPIILLLQMQSPLNNGIAYKQSFDAIYPSLAKKYSLTIVPFLTNEIFLNQENLLADGIHLNKQGYGIVVREHVYPALVAALTAL